MTKIKRLIKKRDKIKANALINFDKAIIKANKINDKIQKLK